MNENYGNLNHQPKPEPWYLKSDGVILPDDYNPYTDEASAFKEIFDENPSQFLGADKLAYETPDMYTLRMEREKEIVKQRSYFNLKKTSGFISLMLLISMLLIEGLTTGASFFALALPATYTNLINNVFSIISYVALFPAVMYVATVGRRTKTFTHFKKPKTGACYIIRWSVIAFGISYMASVLSTLIFDTLRSYGVYINDGATPPPNGVAEHITYFMLAVICAPIFEEILFRGVLLTPLTKYGSWFAAVTTGLLFGLYHQTHTQFLFATVFGIILAFIDMRAGSVIPSIIAHACFNAYSYLTTLTLSFTNYAQTLADPQLTLDGPAIALALVGALQLIMYALMLSALILLVYEIVKDKKQFIFRKTDCSLSIGTRISAFITHPLTVLLLIITLMSIASSAVMETELASLNSDTLREMIREYADMCYLE